LQINPLNIRHFCQVYTRNIILLICLSFGIFEKAVSQERESEFGKVTMDELNLSECSFEKSANAMILDKEAVVTFETRIGERVPKVQTDYWIKIKIFNEKGFSAANINIPYVSESRLTSISDIQAFIYNFDGSGKIIKEKVERKQIYSEKSKARNSINYVSFTFPGLRRGSVIEYHYSKIDKYSMSTGPWFFQGMLPAAKSKITLILPDYISLNYHFVTFEPIDKDSSHKKNGGGFYDQDNISFTMHQIPSFRVEPLMSSVADNLERVEFAISSGAYFRKAFPNSNYAWQSINAILLRSKYFGLQLNKEIESADHLIDSVKQLANVEMRISAVYEYVKKTVEWNGELTFYCDSVEECWQKKKGSSAEMNILLLNLLRRVGIKSLPILVSTRENGKSDNTFASLGQFNNVDVLTAETDNMYILDCTQKGLSYKLPPENVLNSKAFIVDPELDKWIFISDSRILMKNEINVYATLDSNGNVSGETKLVFIGFAKSELMAEEKNKKKGADESANDLRDNFEDIIVDTMNAIGNGENSDTLIQDIHFHFVPTRTDNHYFINPFSFFHFRKHPFTDSIRLYDVDFGCAQEYFISVRLRVADNFSIEDFPRGMSIRMTDTSALFRREIFQQNNDILIRSTFTLKNPYFARENYAALKAFFDKVYGIISEVILVKRIN
jgi:hypothetical protein